MNDFVDDLVELATSVQASRLPPAVIHEGRRVLVDTVGVILGGMAEAETGALAGQMAAASTHPSSTIFGTALQADAMWAALANGTAGVWHDYDGGNRFLGGHPAVHVIPAGFAIAERQACSGAALFDAVLAGYEVAARVGMGTRLRPDPE